MAVPGSNESGNTCASPASPFASRNSIPRRTSSGVSPGRPTIRSTSSSMPSPMQHARGFRHLLRRSASLHAFQRLAVDGLKADLQAIESGPLQLSCLLRREALRPDLGEESERAGGVLADQRIEQRVELRPVIERRIEEDDLARAAIAKRRDQRSALFHVQQAK